MLNRVYTLSLGLPITISSSDLTSVGSFDGWKLDIDDYLQSSSNTSYQISEHNIKFKIIKDGTGSSPNQANVTIYNLHDSLADYLYENQDKDLAVILKAGYEDTNEKEILRGTVVSVLDYREGVDRITKIVVTDGGVNFKESTTARVYSRGTKFDTIVSDLIDDLGLSKDSSAITTLGDDEVTSSTYTVYGTPAGELDRIGHRYKVVFSVQDNIVNFVPVDARVTEQVAYISESTGLINSPKALNASGANKQGDTENINPSIQFDCLLNGDIKPNKTVWLSSDKYDLALKVEKVLHKGEYEGSDWTTTVVGTEVPYTLSTNDVFVRD